MLVLKVRVNSKYEIPKNKVFSLWQGKCISCLTVKIVNYILPTIVAVLYNFITIYSVSRLELIVQWCINAEKKNSK